MPDLTATVGPPAVDLRPEPPERFGDGYAIRCWHWFPPSARGPGYWGQMIYSSVACTHAEAAKSAQWHVGEGDRRVSIVTIPGDADAKEPPHA